MSPAPRKRHEHPFQEFAAATGLVPSMTAGAILLWSAGCVFSPSTGNPPNGGDGGSQPPPTSNPPAFTVTISASNVTPQLNEEVLLRCVPDGDIGLGATFSFQSADIGLQVNASVGSATFVVTESELGQSIDVSCSATDQDGATVNSGRVTVFPTG